MMGHRFCSKQKVKRRLGSPEEDERLVNCITSHGHDSWSSVPKLAGLQSCGKSCSLRPDLKRGTFSADEEQIIIGVHRILGNSKVKNFRSACIKKKLMAHGLDPQTDNLNPAQINSSSYYHQQPYWS